MIEIYYRQDRRIDFPLINTVRLTMGIIENFIWRFTCPKSVDSIAVHFVRNHVPREHIDNLDFDSASIEWQDPWFAYRRRIGSIYGVVISYRPPDDSPTRRGWNRRLWRSHEGLSPDDLVERIFESVLTRLRAKARKPAEQMHASDASPPPCHRELSRSA